MKNAAEFQALRTAVMAAFSGYHALRERPLPISWPVRLGNGEDSATQGTSLAAPIHASGRRSHGGEP
jgi:hypothetical protein